MYLGKIASYYHITFDTMALYNDTLRPNMGEMEMLRLFSLSAEFNQATHVRDEEKIELRSLISKVPVPIKEAALNELSAKINTLLQAYISKLKLEVSPLLSPIHVCPYASI
jgi:pre-mRNA-splicing helicase BRR2